MHFAGAFPSRNEDGNSVGVPSRRKVIKNEKKTPELGKMLYGLKG
jgi:hypothetical protein